MFCEFKNFVESKAGAILSRRIGLGCHGASIVLDNLCRGCILVAKQIVGLDFSHRLELELVDKRIWISHTG